MNEIITTITEKMYDIHIYSKYDNVKGFLEVVTISAYQKIYSNSSLNFLLCLTEYFVIHTYVFKRMRSIMVYFIAKNLLC